MGYSERQEAKETRAHIWGLIKACIVIGIFVWQYATNRGIDVMNTDQMTQEQAVVTWEKITDAKTMNELLGLTTFGDPDAPLFDKRDNLLAHAIKCAGFPMYLVYRVTQTVIIAAARNGMIPSVNGLPTDTLYLCIVIFVQLMLAPAYLFCYCRFFNWFLRPRVHMEVGEGEGNGIGYMIGRILSKGR